MLPEGAEYIDEAKHPHIEGDCKEACEHMWLKSLYTAGAQFHSHDIRSQGVLKCTFCFVLRAGVAGRVFSRGVSHA